MIRALHTLVNGAMTDFQVAAPSAATQLDRFIARYLAQGTPPPEPFDPDWRSACEGGQPYRVTESDGVEISLVDWRPVRQQAPLQALAGLERALDLTLHADIRCFFSRWWSGPLTGRYDDLPVSLIQLWNEEDAERLVGNLIGHALDKRRQRAAFTAFIGTTDPDAEDFISIDNASGNVLLERPGRPPLATLAPDLGAFLDRLKPELPLTDARIL